MIRYVFVCAILLVCATAIATLFWKQELRYALPTPIPPSYSPLLIKEEINLAKKLPYSPDSAIYLHFFSPDCPCSRFNVQHVKALHRTFSNQVVIYAVIPPYADVERAKKLIGSNITVIVDINGEITEACGVYSTPQAVIIDKERKLYFRGNYNKSRYCTVKETNYAELALTALVAGELPPVFDRYATEAYGCELPIDPKSLSVTL